MFKQASYIGLFILIICLTPGITEAQDQTGKGVVVLDNDEVKFGVIKYQQAFEMITVVSNDKHLAYSASHVKYFQYFDQEKSLNRIYKSIKVINNNIPQQHFMPPEFLEMVMLEDLLILRKQKKVLIEPLERTEKGSIVAKNLYSEPVEAIDYDYYFSRHGEIAEPLHDFQKQILPLLNKRYQTALITFIKNNKIDIRKWEGQYEALTYYKELKESSFHPPLLSVSHSNPSFY